MCAKGVDAYFAGHAHHLEFSKSNSCDMDLLISGGGGRKLYPVNHSLEKNQMFAESINGFSKISITEDNLRYEFIRYDNQILFAEQTLKHKRNANSEL